MENKILLTQEDKEQFVFWIETLKAGVLPKGKFRLETENGEYCCLGVAQVCSVENLCLKTNSTQLVGGVPHHSHNSPKWLLEISRIAFKTPRGLFNTLVQLNDSLDMTHQEIAEIVWKNLKHELKGFK